MNEAIGAGTAVQQMAYYVRDVGAVGADAIVTGAGALTGNTWSLGVNNWSNVGQQYQADPYNLQNAALNAGRTGLAGGTAGYSEILIGTYQYAQTGNATAFQQQMGGVAAGNGMQIVVIKSIQTYRGVGVSNGGDGGGGSTGTPVRSLFPEYMRFRNQGFTPAQAKYLSQPYNGVGHHFPITQALARNWRLPNWIRDNPLNVLKPDGISRGRFYERHYQVDPDFYSANFPKRIGGGNWDGSSIGLTKYGPFLQTWSGLSDTLVDTGAAH